MLNLILALLALGINQVFATGPHNSPAVVTSDSFAYDIPPPISTELFIDTAQINGIVDSSSVAIINVSSETLEDCRCSIERRSVYEYNVETESSAFFTPAIIGGSRASPDIAATLNHDTGVAYTRQWLRHVFRPMLC